MESLGPAVHRSAAISALFITGTLVLLGSIGACRQGVPVIDTSPPPPQTDGTISGTVRGPQGSAAITGRTVTVINVATGERQTTTTSNTGGFTFKVKPGRYQVELRLLEGEALVKRPSIINVNPSDIDAHADFVLGVSGLIRQRWPRMRGHDGLGAPST